MSLVVLGTNHRTAKLDLRERWSYQLLEVTTALKHLSARLQTKEVVLLSTCNRTEVYCDVNQPSEVISWFNEEVRPATNLDISEHGYFYQDKDAVSHIMRVASGLDSLVLGEPQILGQFKQAYRLAQKAKTVGKKFDRLFSQVFSVAKSVRSDTDIGLNSMSVASASVNLALNELAEGSISNPNVLLIGSGDTIKTVGRTLIKKNITKISIANRNQIHAQDLADDLIAYAKTKLDQDITVNIHNLDIINNFAHAELFNVIFTATSSPVYLVNRANIVEKLKQHSTLDKLVLIDLAVPRDIDPACAELPQVHLYKIDDLEKILQNNKKQRVQAAKQAEAIISKMANDFCDWESSILLMSSLCKYREQAEIMCREVIERAEKKLDAGQDPKQVVITSLELLRKKLTHHPTITLKNMAKNKSQSEVSELQDLFNL